MQTSPTASGYHPVSTRGDDRSPHQSATSSDPRRPVVDGAAVVHVGAEGGRAGRRPAGRRRVLRRRDHAIGSRRLGRLVRARGSRRGRLRPRHRHRELGAVHSRRRRGARPSGVRRARGQGRGRGGPGRAVPARRARLRRHRPVRLDGRGDGHRGVASDGLRQAGGLRDDRGGVPGRAAVASRPDWLGPDVGPDRAGGVDCRRHPDVSDGLGPREPAARPGVVGDSRVAAPGIEHHGLVPDRRRAGVSRRLLARAPHDRRRRRGCARGA